MRSLTLLAALVVPGALALGVGCSFDDAALSDRICDTTSDCPEGTCVDGVCVLDVGDVAIADGGDTGTVDGGVDVSSDVPVEDGGADGGADGGEDAGGCSFEEPRCDDGAVIVCVDGQEFVEANCADEGACDDALGFGCACIEGACEDRVCDEGEVRCTAGAVESCDDDGQWVDEGTCETGTVCVDGACVEPACDPGTIACLGETRVICDADGEIEDAEDCSAADAWCDDTAGDPVCTPRACAPRSIACAADVGLDGDVALVCDDRGSAWEVGETCEPGVSTCVDGACRDIVCAPGVTSCLDLEVLSVCNALGTGSEETSCEGFCDASGDVPACAEPVCETGDLRCLDVTNVEECAARGSGWTLVETCAAGQICREGACTDQVCEPGTTFCNEMGGLATCADDGSGVISAEACDFRCEDGACVPSVCGDGLVDPATGETCDDGNDDACDGCEGCQRRAGLVMSGSSTSPDGPAWIPAGSDFTLEAWINARSAGGVMGLGGIGETDNVRVTLESGRVTFRYRLDEGREVGIRGQTPVVGAGWTHIAVVRFSTTGAAVFVDGELDGLTYPERDRTGIDAMSGRMWVGSEGSIDAADMDIDAFRVSSNARYLTRFATQRRYGVDATTVALFHFDEGGGTTAVDAANPGRSLTVSGAEWSLDACYGSSPTSLTCGDGVQAQWENCDGGDTCGADCLTTRACRDGVERAGSGRCYLLLTSADSWTNQVRTCRAWSGGDMTAITSGGENNWIRDRFGGTHWIGLNDRGSGWGDEGDFGWTTGEGTGFSRWADGEPNDGGWGGEEDCVEFRGDGTWNDQSCGSGRTALCERAAD